MAKHKPFLFGSLTGAACVFFALQFHVVRSADGFRVVPRTPQHSLGLAYADIRNWNTETWTDRPELARALIANGASDLIASSVADSLSDAITNDNPTMDQLTSIVDDLQRKQNDDFFDVPEFEPLHDSAAPSPIDEGVWAPFPRDAQATSSASSAELSSRRTDVALRDDRIIDSVFSSGFGGFEGLADPPQNEVQDSPPSNSDTAFPVTGEGSRETRHGFPSVESTNGTHTITTDNPTAMFSDAADTLTNRARDALARARVSAESALTESADSTVDSSTRYVRDAAGIRRSTADETENTSGKTFPADEPLAIRALREGFDPFLD